MGRPKRCCRPILHCQWRGNPPWSSNLTDDAAFSTHGDFVADVAAAHHAGIVYQWRIAYDFENLTAETERVLASVSLPLSELFGGGYEDVIEGGPLRDGKLICLPGSSGANITTTDAIFTSGGAFQFPWRLELGCSRCRCIDCSGSGLKIYWPIRNDWLVAPVYSGGDVVYVDAVQYEDSDDYGRAMTDDEITRHFWWGGNVTSDQITITDLRPCPPSEIVWSHRHTLNNATTGKLAIMSGLTQRYESECQTALGWLTDGPGYSPASLTANAGAVYRERFDTVDMSGVNIVTLIQPATYEKSGSLWGWTAPNADPSTMLQSEIDALIEWLDSAPRLLVITGCADTLGNTNSFLSRFCDLRYTATIPDHPAVPPTIPGITLNDNSSGSFYENPRLVPTSHEYATSSTVYFGRTPNFWDHVYYPGASGGETLYNIEYDRSGVQSFSAVTMETRDNGSRIILAPMFGVQQVGVASSNITDSTLGNLVTYSPFFHAIGSPTSRAGWLGPLPDALVSQYA